MIAGNTANLSMLSSVNHCRLFLGFAVLSIVTGAAPATDSAGSIRGPVLGYVSQSPLELRVIAGAPGAATFGSTISLSADVARVRVAPGEPYAYLERRGSVPAVLQLTGETAGQTTVITGAIRSADVAAFSPFGTSLVLFSAGAARLQVLTGFPAAPRIVRDLDAHSLPEVPLALAVSDDGESVLMSSASTAYLLLPDGSARTVIATGSPAAMAFFPNSREAALGDPQSGSIYHFDGHTGPASLRAVSAALKGLGAVGASADGDTIYVLNAGSRQMISLRLSAGGLDSLQLPVTPERMDRLGKTDHFLISSEPGRPAWMLAGQEKRAVFVPDLARPRPRPRYVPMPAGGSR